MNIMLDYCRLTKAGSGLVGELLPQQTLELVPSPLQDQDSPALSQHTYREGLATFAN